MGYGYGYDLGTTSGGNGFSLLSLLLPSSTAALVWFFVSLVLALVGGIVLYFTVFANKNEGKYKGFMAWLYDFVKFKKLYITTVLKITYMVLALFMTLNSFASIGSNFVGFLLTITLGNLFLRVMYEFSLVILSIHENVSEINKKMKK